MCIGKCVVPKAKTADKRVGIFPGTTTGGQFFQSLDVPAPENHVVWLKSCDESLNHVPDVFSPFASSILLQTAKSHVILVRGFSIWEMAELHRRDRSIGNEGGPETRAETEEEHTSASIAAKCLHGRIVDQFDGTAERCLIVEADPAGA